MQRIIIITVIFFLIYACSSFSFEGNRMFQIKLLNDELRELAEDQGIKILDTYSLFMSRNNSPVPEYFADDGLHLSKKGYENWVNSGLIPYLDEREYSSIGMVGNSITAGIEGFVWEGTSVGVSNWQILLNSSSRNFGVGGNTSRQVLDRIDDITAYDIDCYFLLIGINDLAIGVPVWKTVVNIEKILKKLKEDGAHVVLQLVLPVL